MAFSYFQRANVLLLFKIEAFDITNYVFASAEVSYFALTGRTRSWSCRNRKYSLLSVRLFVCVHGSAIRQCGAAAAKIKQITNIYEIYRRSQSVMTLALRFYFWEMEVRNLNQNASWFSASGAKITSYSIKTIWKEETII